jgi:hypothetical protein
MYVCMFLFPMLLIKNTSFLWKTPPHGYLTYVLQIGARDTFVLDYPLTYIFRANSIGSWRSCLLYCPLKCPVPKASHCAFSCQLILFTIPSKNWGLMSCESICIATNMTERKKNSFVSNPGVSRLLLITIKLWEVHKLLCK